jgi:hypothetical protein
LPVSAGAGVWREDCGACGTDAVAVGFEGAVADAVFTDAVVDGTGLA